MTVSTTLPLFYLYGEPSRLVDEAFVHVEDLDERSRPNLWTIRPHTHKDLNHIFHVACGGGSFWVEDREIRIMAPCLLIVPARTAHGFQWQSESSGSVITISTHHLRSLCERDAELRDVFRNAEVVTLRPLDVETVQSRIAVLMREYTGKSPGRRAALDAGLLDLIVVAFRGLAPSLAENQPLPGSQAELVARLRQRLEERFRLRESIADYAHALGVSLYQLRTACSQVARLSPSEMLDQLAMQEARRALLYSNQTVSEVAFSLGFTDMAYFSRFFSRRAGCSPRAYRQRRVAITSEL